MHFNSGALAHLEIKEEFSGKEQVTKMRDLIHG